MLMKTLIILMKIKFKGDNDEESKGFKEGYKEGVEFYFKMAE
ncbi:hypothetical protein SH2C18_23880 [Clostridium sediminicola]